MEKHTVTNICRLSVVFMVIGSIVATAHANSLLNPGFETVGTNAATAANWNQFNNAGLSSTNIGTGTGFPITAHSGANAMQTQAPANTNFDASGAYQDVAASPGQNWRLTGYTLNWQNSQMVGPGTFATAQLAFLDSTNGIISTFDGPHFGFTNAFPLNVWSPFQIDATAPAGTATIRTYVLYVGNSAAHGSAYFDDLNLYQPTGTTTPQSVTTAPAVNVSWPTSAALSNFVVNYQIQSTTNLIFTNIPPVNVLSNASFDAGATTNGADLGTSFGWALQGGGGKAVSCYPHPTHSGAGALKMTDTTTAVPVASQGGPFQVVPHPINPGDVWDLQGYAYISSTNAGSDTFVGGFGLLKIVWNDVNGTALQPVPGDTNAIGSPVTGQFPGIESLHITTSSTRDSWNLIEARGTAPAGAAFGQAFCILVGSGGGGAMRFDDLTFAKPVSTFGWANLGPVFTGTGGTNNITDLIKTNQNFYRVMPQ